MCCKHFRNYTNLNDRTIQACSSFLSIFSSLSRSIFVSKIRSRLFASTGSKWSNSSASFVLPVHIKTYNHMFYTSHWGLLLLEQSGKAMKLTTYLHLCSMLNIHRTTSSSSHIVHGMKFN
jgi:hypothetical protein